MKIIAWILSLFNFVYGSIYILVVLGTLIGGMMGGRVSLSYDMLVWPIFGLCVSALAFVLLKEYLKRLKWVLIVLNSIVTVGYVVFSVGLLIFV